MELPRPGGGAIPLGEVAKVQFSRGPTMIRTENGQLTLYIYVDITGRDLGGYPFANRPDDFINRGIKAMVSALPVVGSSIGEFIPAGMI